MVLCGKKCWVMSNFGHDGIQIVGFENSAGRFLAIPWLMKSKQVRSGWC